MESIFILVFTTSIYASIVVIFILAFKLIVKNERIIKMIKMAGFFKRKHRLMVSTGFLCIIFLSGVLLTIGNTYGSVKKHAAYGSLDALLQYKTTYVGNNSKVINLISNLNYAEFKGVTSLQTKKTPYGVTVDYNFKEISKVPSKKEAVKAFRYNAIMMFCLINNVDVITFKLSGLLNTTYQFKRETIQQFFLKDIRAYSKDSSSLNILSNSINFTVFTAPEKYSSLMSSTPGIQISFNPIKDSVVKYTANKGTFLTWDRQTSKIKNYGKSATFHNPTYVYWSSINNTSIAKGKNYIDIEISNTLGKPLIEKRLQISKAGEYSVINGLDSVVNKNIKIEPTNVNAIKDTVGNNNATNTNPKKLTLKDAAKLITLSAGSSASADTDTGVSAGAGVPAPVPANRLKEITTEDFWGQLKAQVYKSQSSKDSIASSYFIKENKVLDLGYNSGTFDTKDICVTDLDKDGNKELLYYNNFGSGIQYSFFHCYVNGRQLKSNFSSIKFCGFTFIKKDLQNVELGVWYPDLIKGDKNSTPIGKLYIKNNELCIKLYDNLETNLKNYISIKK